MSNNAKYTTNFTNRTLSGTYSGADLPTFTEEDVGKSLVINENGGIVPGEGGSSNTGALIIHKNGRMLDKTWAEINDAFAERLCILIRDIMLDETVFGGRVAQYVFATSYNSKDTPPYQVIFLSADSSSTYISTAGCSAPDEYPQFNV